MVRETEQVCDLDLTKRCPGAGNDGCSTTTASGRGWPPLSATYPNVAGLPVGSGHWMSCQCA
jgi:hypothetical protein